MITVIHRTALGLALLAGAHAAPAATVTFNNWTFGSGNAVHTVQPAYSGAAGGFSATVDGVGLTTYCVELTQDFNWNTRYTNFTDGAAADYFGAGSDKTQKLAQLVSYAFYDTVAHVSNAAQSTSLQLAIWNVIYDDDHTLSSGSFADTSRYAGYATTLLSASQSFTNLADVRVLASPTQQDQLHWSRASPGRPSNANDVPEPGALALVLIALGAAALALRGRA